MTGGEVGRNLAFAAGGLIVAVAAIEWRRVLYGLLAMMLIVTWPIGWVRKQFTPKRP